MNDTQCWTASDSRDLYKIDKWGHGFFKVSDKGEVTVTVKDTHGNETHASIVDIINHMRETHADFQLPTLFRFPSILRSRIEELFHTFNTEMERQDYKGRFSGVYPVKVNQQQQVIREVTEIGREYHYGLEVGTKPELLAALAYFHDKDAPLICNGYKDREFVDIALRAQQMGLNVILVLETAEELPIIQETAALLGVQPTLGLRVKLSTESSGLWQESGGENSPFGLNFPQIVALVDTLKAAGQLHWLRMLHYHQGSQVPEISDIRAAVYEAARIYVSLYQEGAPMGILDCGGGLAVDYDGSHSNSPSSKNYTVSEYCADLIEGIRQVTDQAGVPNPDIITESGRAIVAYYSMLVFNILDVTQMDPVAPPMITVDQPHHMLLNLADLVESVNKLPATECYNDARYYYEQIRSLFYHGVISLREKAYADEVYWYVTRRSVRMMIENEETIPDELEKLSSHMVDYYYGNFSIFQSLPDSWALHQIFPIMPIHRLEEEPTRKAVISDITCDCDGLLDRFISEDSDPQQSHLLLHSLHSDSENNLNDYYLGAFLVGAYQETLGDLHNLLGDTNVVSVTYEDGELKHEIKLLGDTVSEVLSYLEYRDEDLLSSFQTSVDSAVTNGNLPLEKGETIMETYRKILDSYTYFARWRKPTQPQDED
ncbi:MAG: arginine decarboxylase [Verrucomicrobiales bacterium]|jgi:arginine decarboxylase